MLFWCAFTLRRSPSFYILRDKGQCCSEPRCMAALSSTEVPMVMATLGG